MRFLQDQVDKLRIQYRSPLKPLIIVISIIFSLALFDGIISYLVPDIILKSGVSEFHMGIIVASSSFFGMIFDLTFDKMFDTTHYKKMLFYTIILCILFPLTLLFSSSILLFLLGMAIWALYCNLWGFATYDFVSRESKMAFHATSMALFMTFNDLGYVFGTLFATPLSESVTNINLFIIFLVILVPSLVLLLFLKKGRSSDQKLEELEEKRASKNWRNLLTIIRRTWPLLLLNVTIIIVQGVTWTVTPVIDRIAPDLEGYGGIILALTFIPSFIAYANTDRISKKFGKKRTAIGAFILSSLFLVLQGFATDVFAYIFLSTLSNFISSLLFPSLGGAYADYLQESKSFDKEILVSRSLSGNLGWVLGPILGGLLMQLTDSIILFTYLGVGSIIIGIIVFLFTPKKIDFHDKSVLN